MTERVPLLSMQLSFALMTERTGKRTAIYEIFRMERGSLSLDELINTMNSILLRNPALSYTARFSQGMAYQEFQDAHALVRECAATSTSDVMRLCKDAVEGFENSSANLAIAAHLVRAPECDHVLLIFDHANIDGHSIDLINRQLAATAPPDEGAKHLFESAVRHRAASEADASRSAGLDFWKNRLSRSPEAFPRGASAATPVSVPLTSLPAVPRPRGLRGSLFPYVLFSLHRALRDVGSSRTTSLAYAWGKRDASYSEVAGCFLNTVISLDSTRSANLSEALPEFLDGWYSEIDNADVPFISVASLGTEFSGAVSGLLTYALAPSEAAISIAGKPAVEVAPQYGHSQPISSFTAAATVGQAEIALGLLVNDEAHELEASMLGSQWHRRLTQVLDLVPNDNQVD